MRKRILRDYVLVVTAALLCGFLIFYLVVSNIMMESDPQGSRVCAADDTIHPGGKPRRGTKDDLSDSLRGDDSRHDHHR